MPRNARDNALFESIFGDMPKDEKDRLKKQLTDIEKVIEKSSHK